jgi:DNA-binding transcriptional ArsR family regulator
MSQPAISHHLKVLEKAGLILRERRGTTRPCRLAPQGLAPVETWLAQLRDAMEANYARLDALLAEDDPHQES